MNRFCLEMVRHLCNGRSWTLGNGLGSLELIKKERKNPAIDWGESIKKRKEIIANGGTPYRVTHRKKDGTVVKDNGGEPWFVWHVEDFCWLIWKKKWSQAVNKKYYKVTPVYTMMNAIVDVAKTPSKSTKLRYLELKTEKSREEARQAINRVSLSKD